MALDVAVDIGGTFTDLVGHDRETGRTFTIKSSTTPDDLTRGILHCIEKSGAPVGEALRFVHGSTVAINTVIERTGVETALVVTRGTRDVYKIGRGNRPQAYDIFFERPAPLVPRHLTFEVDERLGPDGSVWHPFDDEQAHEVAKAIRESGVSAVAVCFLHSWHDPAHEKRMGAILADALPDVYLTLSHEILKEYGEYERISTTVLNAYMGPKVRRYLEDLERMLAEREFRGGLLVMQSNGGVMTPEVAKQTPVAMLESGPVAGFIAAARVGARLGRPNVIAFDMGGTTAKTNLVTDGEPRMAHGYHIGGYTSGQPVMLPVVDTVEVGSGGGSIAWVDPVGALAVGPRSAGADPGPMCYRRGGTEPTVTDANLVLGRLPENALLGGEMSLDSQEAERGIRDHVAGPLGMSVVDAALAIVKIAVMKMSLAVREVSVERGYDPRDFVMVAFGGAGPLHAVEVARELHIPAIVVPSVPGQFSAAGMLMADVKHDYVQTVYQELESADLSQLKRVVDELTDEGRRRLASEGVADAEMEFRPVFEMRYSGQDFALPIPIVSEITVDSLRAAFNEHHERQYGYHDADRALEFVNARLTAIGKSGGEVAKATPSSGSSQSSQQTTTRPVVFASGEDPVPSPVFRRDALASDTVIEGPAIIQDYGSTTLLFPGDVARVTETGELSIDLGAAT